MSKKTFFIPKEDIGKGICVGLFIGKISGFEPQTKLIQCDLKGDPPFQLDANDTCQVQDRDFFHGKLDTQNGKRVYLRVVGGLETE